MPWSVDYPKLFVLSLLLFLLAVATAVAEYYDDDLKIVYKSVDVPGADNVTLVDNVLIIQVGNDTKIIELQDNIGDVDGYVAAVLLAIAALLFLLISMQPW